MKRIYDCQVCEKEFKANNPTSYKTCKDCRNKKIYDNAFYVSNHRIKQKEIVDRQNKKFKSLKHYRTNGRYSLVINIPCYNLGNSLTNLNDDSIYIKYIENAIKKLQKDLDKLK